MYKERYCGHELFNVTEDVVFFELHHVIASKQVDFCRCEICLLDIAAITLNQLPPVYWGNRYEKYSPRTDEQKAQAEKLHRLAHERLLLAIEIVKVNPHH